MRNLLGVKSICGHESVIAGTAIRTHPGGMIADFQAAVVRNDGGGRRAAVEARRSYSCCGLGISAFRVSTNFDSPS